MIFPSPPATLAAVSSPASACVWLIKRPLKMETQRDINYNRFLMNTEFSQDDFISKMPSSLKTNILNRLPIQEAVRTSVLSKIWNRRWKTITEWVFDDKFVNYLSEKRCMHEFYMTILDDMIHRMKGLVTKFVLYTPRARRFYNLKPGEYNEICGRIIKGVNEWVQCFCNMGNLNELVVVNMLCQPLILKSLVFGFENITRLQLRNCKVKLPHEIHFPNLLRLEYCEHLYDRIGEVIKKCLLLEDLRISECAVNAEEIVGLQKLKILHLFLYIFRNGVTSSNIYTLLHGLPKLEEVHLNFWECRFLVEAGEGRFTATFPCLNSLSLVGIDFTRSSMITNT